MPSKGRGFLKKLKLKLLLAGILLYSHPALAVDVKSTGGLKVTSKDAVYSFALGGTLHLDEVVFSGNAYDKQGDFPSGANIRRLYLDFQGGIGKDWSYRLTPSFKGSTVIIRSAYLNYQCLQDANLQIGQVSIPSGLENNADPNDWLFLEGSLLTGAFFPEDDYGLGLYASKPFADTWTLAGALYQPRKDLSNNYGDLGRPDRLAEAFRLTYSPVHNEAQACHLGVWYRHQTLVAVVGGAPVSSTTGFQGFSTVPEAETRNTASLVNTGPIQARNYDLAGVEFAWMEGPALIQTEYLNATVHRVLPTVHFHAWHLQGSYVLTGESHGYDFPSGTFTRVKPANPCGAWEIAARYSNINLNDRELFGGTEYDITVGLNWYVNEQVRIAANYIRANARPTNISNPGVPGGPKRKLDIIALRFQVAF